MKSSSNPQVSLHFPSIFPPSPGGLYPQPLQRPQRRLRRVVGQRPGRGRPAGPPTAAGDDDQSALGAAGGDAITGRGAPWDFCCHRWLVSEIPEV